MTTSATVPVTITTQAGARIAQSGLQREVERIIQHACSVLPDLESIQVNLYDRHELADEPGLSIDVYSRRPYDRHNSDERNLIRWMVTKFPPQVLEQIIIDYHPANNHAG